MSGGEIAALAIMDSVLRLLPGVLNDADSARQDSFNEALTGLLDSPHYTRPEQYQNMAVPAELLSGYHSHLFVRGQQQSLTLTELIRTDRKRAAPRQSLLS